MIFKITRKCSLDILDISKTIETQPKGVRILIFLKVVMILAFKGTLQLSQITPTLFFSSIFICLWHCWVLCKTKNIEYNFSGFEFMSKGSDPIEQHCKSSF